jgi:hypothetical protein
LIEPAPPPAEEDEQVDIATPEPIAMGDQTASPKVVQLIELLKMQPWDSKSLVFSQFTSFLDKVGNKILFTIQFAEPYCQIETALNTAQYAANECFCLTINTFQDPLCTI